MLYLILFGLLASSLPTVHSWFWGFYIAAWVFWAIKFILELVMTIYTFRVNGNSFDIK